MTLERVATLSSSGQITLPKTFRDMIGLKSGDKANIELKDGAIVIRRQKTFEEVEAEMEKLRQSFSEETKRLIKKNAGKTVNQLRQEIDNSPEGRAYYERKFGPNNYYDEDDGDGDD